MEFVVRSGIKADLHIHSYLSAHKDGKKVKQNTPSNLSILVDKLLENEVNLCAITDHDAFSFSLYKILKAQENNDNSIKKVLPGVEFSVEFEGDTNSKVIHIITIFNDSDEEKLKEIEKILSFDNGKPRYDSNEAFSESKYVSLLKQIGLDTVIIAHQKNSLLSNGKEKQNDASTLGTHKFNEFLFFDYFEAYEFRNKKNEIFNKKYIFENKADDSLRMITGSDCHNWSIYPNEEINTVNELAFTFIKCLPSFKGLVMAVTGSRRLKFANSFFNPAEVYLDAIEIQFQRNKQTIPLSAGINVIIGDNSIGKSLLLHKITGFRNVTSTSLKRGYEKYLRDNQMDVLTTIPDNEIFRFDTQGGVRRQFEEGLLKASEFLQPFFPPDINPSTYRILIEPQLRELFDAIANKFEFDRKKHSLPSYKLYPDSSQSQSLTFLESLECVKIQDNRSIIDNLIEVSSKLSTLKNNKSFDIADASYIERILGELLLLQEKYEKRELVIQTSNKKINCIKTVVKRFKSQYAKQVTDVQKIKSSYLENQRDTVESIVNLVNSQKKLIDFKFDIQTRQIDPSRNEVFQYIFISKLNIEEISSAYLMSVVSKVLKKDKKISTKTITNETLRKILLHYDDASDPLDFFKQKITAIIDKDFEIRHSIIENDMDVYKELSDGLNAQIYFTLITGETKNKGIYIIDQPEDHVSPTAITGYLLDKFKDMGETRQVIIITHNPQFIVNLDVDNVVFLSKPNKHPIRILSGALEYENNDTNILQIIADNIEGGINTIARRMKRYEKGLPAEIRDK